MAHFYIKNWKRSHTTNAEQRTFGLTLCRPSFWVLEFLKHAVLLWHSGPLFNPLVSWCYSVHPPHWSWANRPKDWGSHSYVSGHTVAGEAIWEEMESSGLMTWGSHMTYYFGKMDWWPEDCCLILCSPCALERRQLTWIPPVNIRL